MADEAAPRTPFNQHEASCRYQAPFFLLRLNKSLGVNIPTTLSDDGNVIDDQDQITLLLTILIHLDYHLFCDRNPDSDTIAIHTTHYSWLNDLNDDQRNQLHHNIVRGHKENDHQGCPLEEIRNPICNPQG